MLLSARPDKTPGKFKNINNYAGQTSFVGALRQLTRRKDPEVFIRVLNRLHEFSSTIVSEDMIKMQQILEEINAFLEHTEAKLKF